MRAEDVVDVGNGVTYELEWDEDGAAEVHEDGLWVATLWANGKTDRGRSNTGAVATSTSFAAETLRTGVRAYGPTVADCLVELRRMTEAEEDE